MLTVPVLAIRVLVRFRTKVSKILHKGMKRKTRSNPIIILELQKIYSPISGNRVYNSRAEIRIRLFILQITIFYKRFLKSMIWKTMNNPIICLVFRQILSMKKNHIDNPRVKIRVLVFL